MVVYTFPKGISPKVNVITSLLFELNYYDVTDPDDSHNDTGILTTILSKQH